MTASSVHRDEIIRLRHSGMSNAAIAQKLRLTAGIVSGVISRSGEFVTRERKAPPTRTQASLTGDNMADPKRADRLLRRFSWQDSEPA